MIPRRLYAWVEISCRSKYAANAKSWIQHTMLKVSRLSWPYRLILHKGRPGRLHSMKQWVLLDMLESWLHIMFPHLTGCKNVTFLIFISLSLSSSLSLSFSLSYTLLVCWAFTQPPICITWSRLFRSFNPWFSHTLIKSVVSKHHQKYYWKLSTVPTYYLSTYYLLSKWS